MKEHKSPKEPRNELHKSIRANEYLRYRDLITDVLSRYYRSGLDEMIRQWRRRINIHKNLGRPLASTHV